MHGIRALGLGLHGVRLVDVSCTEEEGRGYNGSGLGLYYYLVGSTEIADSGLAGRK